MKIKLLSTLVLAMAVSRLASAGEPTAFDLVKQGNKYVGDQSKDKVVQIRSEKSVGTLTPNLWYIVYYDPDANFKSVQVKFGAGQKMDVSHPWRILEMGGKARETFDNSKLKIDSDRAIKTAAAQPLLKNLTVKATQLFLVHGDTGPQWKVQLWAAKLKDPNANADIGAVWVSAEDGSVVKSDLHPNHVD
jgi:hypothetical protein